VLQEALCCQQYCPNGKNIDSSVGLQASATSQAQHNPFDGWMGDWAPALGRCDVQQV
jgi:hypothetical protein